MDNLKKILEALKELGLYEKVNDYLNRKPETDTKGKWKFLSQKDPAWNNHKLGNTTIGANGCTITDLSMFSYWYGDYKTPDWIADNLKFTADGKVYWSSMNGKLPMNFVYRYYNRDDIKIKNILASENNVCLLEVNNKKHWVALIGFDKNKGYKVSDPWYGDSCYLFDRYPNITGFCELKRA